MSERTTISCPECGCEEFVEEKVIGQIKTGYRVPVGSHWPGLLVDYRYRCADCGHDQEGYEDARGHTYTGPPAESEERR